MKGVTDEPIWLGISFIVLILTGVIFYSLFSPSECDADAKLTMQEIRSAIECAAENPSGIDPITGQLCNQATVKLCQLSEQTIAGSGFFSAYYGLAMPDYMVYFKKFPRMDVKESHGGAPFHIKWSESYPFERVGVGQRVWDTFRLTFTQYKQYSRTQYLEDGCTSNNALCFNTRGMEQVVDINTPEHPVRINRAEFESRNEVENDDGEFTVLISAESNPNFHLISPCYGKLTFYEDNEGRIIGYLEKYNTETSNYCFADDTTLMEATGAYTAEVACVVADAILTVLSFGTDEAAKEALGAGAKKASTTASTTASGIVVKKSSTAVVGSGLIKAGASKGTGTIVTTTSKKTLQQVGFKKVTKFAALRHFLKSFGARRLGFPLSKKQALLMLGVPCLDLDICRGAGSCLEVMAMWPGYPFTDLTSADMDKHEPTTHSATEVFVQCCAEYIYGATKDPDNIICDDPSYLADLVKVEVDRDRYDADTMYDLNMSALAAHLSIPEENIPGLCSLIKSDYNLGCEDAIESRGLSGDCAISSEYNFELSKMVETSSFHIAVALHEPSSSSIVLESSSDGNTWTFIGRVENDKLKDTEITQQKFSASENYDADFYILNYLRLREEPIAGETAVGIDYAEIIIGSFAEAKRAIKNTEYDLTPFTYNYFITPYEYSTTARELCASISNCTTVSIGDQTEGTDQKYSYDEEGEGIGFEIRESERIGIFTIEASAVTFH